MNGSDKHPESWIVLRQGFWGNIHQVAINAILPMQWNILLDAEVGGRHSHCIENFKVAAGDKEGRFFGRAFQDSDLAKWLEAAAYALKSEPDPALEARADEVIDLIARTQRDDGYLDTYYAINGLEKRFTNLRDDHELYVAGHMMEAAVAYYEATGKRRLLNIALKLAHCIDAHIGREPGKKRGYPGHPEIELALMRMYYATGERFLFELARYFIYERGTQPSYFDWEQETYHTHAASNVDRMNEPTYAQYHLPVLSQETLEGHCVRGLYLLCGMIDVAAESGDVALMEASRRLFDDVVKKRMYVTGGVGSTSQGEAFTLDYDLPNDTAYAETCASIALIFAAQRMLQCEKHARYADIIERALYNGCLSGMSLDGKEFFYVNPLEASPEKSRLDPGKKHVLTRRQNWFSCACCPPNLARLLLSLERYIYDAGEGAVYVNQFIPSDAALKVGNQTVRIGMETDYPGAGRVRISAGPGRYALKIRIPQWCKSFGLRVNGVNCDFQSADGYAVLARDWRAGDEVALEFEMRPRRVYAHPAVSDDIGKTALARGPLIYCLEQADNGPQLHRLALPRAARIEETTCPLNIAVPALLCEGVRIDEDCRELYEDDRPPEARPRPLRFIPYFAWANREEGEMAVWVREIV